MRISVKLLVISEAVLLVAVLALLIPVRGQMREQIVMQMQDELRSIAVNAAPLLSGNLHEQVEVGGADTAAFATLRRKLIAIRDLNDVDYEHIYTFYRDGDQVRFGVMTHAGKTFVGDPYPMQPGMREVFDLGVVHATELYEDDKGKWISAYAPIANADGRVVGLLEVDKPGEKYFDRVSMVTNVTLLMGALALAISSLLGWRVLDALVIRPVRSIREGVVALGQRNFAHRVQLATHDEFQDLGEALNQISKDLDAAKVVQASFFPKRLPASAEYALAGDSTPCDATGGDYYDAFEVDAGGIAILLGDVSGHGLAPSLLMATCRAAVHALGGSRLAPGELIDRLHRLLADDLTEGRFITMIYGVVAPDGTFTYCNAGHGPALVVVGDGPPRYLLSHRPPLGIEIDLDGANTQTTLTLPPGSRIVFASDGIPEAMDADGRYLGLEALEQAATDRSLDCHAVVERVREAVNTHCRGPSRTDDVTILCVDRRVST